VKKNYFFRLDNYNNDNCTFPHLLLSSLLLNYHHSYFTDIAVYHQWWILKFVLKCEWSISLADARPNLYPPNTACLRCPYTLHSTALSCLNPPFTNNSVILLLHTEYDMTIKFTKTIPNTWLQITSRLHCSHQGPSFIFFGIGSSHVHPTWNNDFTN